MIRRIVLPLVVAALLGAGAAAPAPAAVVWAVGDGGVAGPEDDAVAARIEREGLERLLYLGDVYETGTAQEYRDYYAPSFGRFRSVSSPTPGNHEWGNRAEGYDPYWGSRAPQTNGGHYYSFDFAGWHFVSLNTEEDVSSSSPQLDWLRRDLARYAGTCTIAFFHRPRYSSGPSPDSDTRYEPIWNALAGRAVAALSGHDHNYQRSRPERGITQWIVGSGGRGLHATDESDPRFAAVNDSVHGALKLNLVRGQAGFEFVSSDGGRLDSGSLACTPHDAGGPGPTPTPTPTPSPGPAPSPTPAPTSSPGTAQPGGSGGDGGSGATVRPAVRVLHPRNGARYSRRLRGFRGTAQRPAGTEVRLTLARRSGRSCVAFDGRRFRRSRCARLPTFVPPGGSQWRFRLPARPARGRYRIVARVTGPDGVLVRDSSTFRIR